MKRVGVANIDTMVAYLEGTLKQPSFIHQGNILEHDHGVGGALVLFCHMKNLLPIVVFGEAHHAHLVDVIPVVEHERQGKNNACSNTQYRDEILDLRPSLDQIPATPCHDYRDSTKHPERDSEEGAAVERCYEAGHACKRDIFEFLI